MPNDAPLRLSALCDKLIGVVLEEANPDNWQGAGHPLDTLTKTQRGDRYWDKKNAAASLTLLIKVHSLRGMQPRHPLAATEEEVDLAQQINQAEKEATAILERLMQKG